MGEKDDGLGLGLSLRLGCEGETRSLEPSLQLGNYHMRRPSQQHPMQMLNPHHRITSWNEMIFQSSGTNRINCPAETRSFLGISVNRSPVVVVDLDQEDQQNGAVSSPNSTVSSISGKRSEREAAAGGCGEETEAERASCSRGSDEEDGSGGADCDEAARKKLRLSKDQALVLEETFKEHNTLNPKEKLALAKQLNLRPRQVEVWFQNRRARTKLKQTEVDCEYLKRCCENLTQENRRLQKEVHELRALKLSPQLYMHMNPPTTLTMCPQCERVSSSSSSSTSPAAAAAAATPTPAPANSNLRHPLSINLWATTTIQR